MGRVGSPLGYVVALFDVMGFESRIKTIGLDEILKKYMSIVELINRNSERNRLLIDQLNVSAPIFVVDGEPFNVYDIHAAYASDTIILWSNLAWRMVQNYSPETLKRNANHSAYGHLSDPVPLRTFLTMCAEVICRCIEVDLPLRGAIAMGDAIFDEKNRIFLGQPMVDAARLENQQHCIGLALCSSYVKQFDHLNFFLPYSGHLKEDGKGIGQEFALNWPHYWNISRKGNIKDVIEEMAKKNHNHQYYKNTIAFIEFSETFNTNSK